MSVHLDSHDTYISYSLPSPCTERQWVLLAEFIFELNYTTDIEVKTTEIQQL